MRVSILSGCLATVFAVVILSCDKAEEKKAASTSTDIPATDVAKHNTAADCWIIINSNVYDVTSFLSKHEGGASAISAYCGNNATTAFENKHAGNETAIAASETYLIGKLAAVTATATATATPSPYSMTEVAKHNTVADCWMVIDSKIYDVSNFFPDTAPNTQATSCDGLGTVTTASMNELTKRGVCAFTNYPLSHLGWSQTAKAGIAPNATTNYVVWNANKVSNIARRKYAASYCGSNVTDVFHGVTKYTVPDHGGTGVSADFQFDHTSNNEGGVAVPDGTITPYTEYKGVVEVLLTRFYKADLAQ